MPSTSELCIDGHVHVHPAYDESMFLKAAYENLSKHGNGFPTLFLAEMSQASVFARWRSGNSPWKVTLTDETVSLILGGKLLVIAGRQIATAERLEVLALFSNAPFNDGEGLESTIETVTLGGALPVLPWGVGKWTGGRGQLVARAAGQPGVLLGDNAGRPVGWPAPSIFQKHIVLPGTDPLRLRSEQRLAGTYGFELHGDFDLSRPAKCIRAALEKLTSSPQAFGRRVGLATFVRQQLGLRLAREPNPHPSLRPGCRSGLE
jgi:hypothetical protein